MSSKSAISSLSVIEAIDMLSSGEWMVPQFQREFVWDVAAITSLATSIIDGYPIGMMTLWDKPDDELGELDLISVIDYNASKKESFRRFFGKGDSKTPQAILDGRQRSTALAMLFAGFCQHDNRKKYAGRFFLDITATEPSDRIVFCKHNYLEKKGLITDVKCKSEGLFPLSPSNGKELAEQWMDYLSDIANPEMYSGGVLPEPAELERRVKTIRAAFKGIINSHIAVYTVPKGYDLGKICDIFETLNQTGIKVSTIDLVHSLVLTKTQIEGDPIAIRDWMDEVALLNGAEGWVSSEHRPELTAQLVTACYIARTNKPAPPNKTRGKTRDITTLKSNDLLTTPATHWRQMVTWQTEFSSFLADFQTLVAGGLFQSRDCPYPVVSAIYVALRWHRVRDYQKDDCPWEIDDLNALYKAFFWRNALTSRYDQGYLATLGTDIRFFKEQLPKRDDFSTLTSWVDYIQPLLEKHMKRDLPSHDSLIEILLNGRPGGAMQAAVRLKMLAGTAVDIAGKNLVQDRSKVHLHHIFPKVWCKNNAAAGYEEILDVKKSPFDYVNSTANLMPLHRDTNIDWKDMSPGAYIERESLRYSAVENGLKQVFIDENSFELLKNGVLGVQEFWSARAENMAAELLAKTKVTY
jgi:hypothetical protein